MPGEYFDPDLIVIKAPADREFTFTNGRVNSVLICDQDSKIAAYIVFDREIGERVLVLTWRGREIAFNTLGGERLSKTFLAKTGHTRNSLVHVLDRIICDVYGKTGGSDPAKRRAFDIRKFDGFSSEKEQQEFVSLAIAALRVCDFCITESDAMSIDRIGVFISEDFQRKLDSGEFIQ